MAISIQQISKSIENIIKKSRTPLTYIPAVILACSSIQRTGLSAKSIAANIIRRQSEAGAPVGRAADGSQNIAEAMEVIRVEEIIKAFKMDARVDVAIPSGSINVVGTVQTPMGPGTCIAQNPLPFNIYGIVR